MSRAEVASRGSDVHHSRVHPSGRSAHGLLSLPVALVLLQEELYRAKASGQERTDPNALAVLIAAAIPLYEYGDDPAVPARLVTKDPREGLFRDAGRELHFSDGTPAKRRLAVQADELVALIGRLVPPPGTARRTPPGASSR
ncbi:MAG TPA: hypothetical protein VGF58_14685 [Burkholderiales bacterium]